MAKRSRRRKRRRGPSPGNAAERSRSGGSSKRSSKRTAKPKAARALRRLDEVFHELRFEPQGSKRELLSVLLLSFGALALGAGIYAQWFWGAAEPPFYAPILIVAGVALVAAYAFLAPDPIDAFVVGDLGVGVEKDGRVRRCAWYEVETLTFAHNALVLKTPGKPLLVPMRDNTAAVRHIVSEALARLPQRVDIDEAEVGGIGAPKSDVGETVEAAPPQVTDRTCRASDMPLSIEKDVRMCAQCGVFYHRKGVPSRCAECERRLKRG